MRETGRPGCLVTSGRSRMIHRSKPRQEEDTGRLRELLSWVLPVALGCDEMGGP